MKWINRIILTIVVVLFCPVITLAQDYDYVGEAQNPSEEPVFYRHAFKVNITTIFFTDISGYYEYRYKSNRSLEVNLGYIRSPKAINEIYSESSGDPYFMHKGFFIAGGYKFIFQKKTKFQFYFMGRIMYRYSGFKNEMLDYSYHTGIPSASVDLSQTKNSIGLQPMVGIILGEQLLWEFYGGLGIKGFSMKTTYNACNYCTPPGNTSQVQPLAVSNGTFYSFTLHLGVKLGLAMNE